MGTIVQTPTDAANCSAIMLAGFPELLTREELETIATSLAMLMLNYTDAEHADAIKAVGSIMAEYEARLEALPRCVECNTRLPFPSRSDSAYCSTACRMRAYRERRKVERLIDALVAKGRML